MEPGTERVILIIADISGYTKFMLANQRTLVHGQMIITKLLEEIIREVEIPLHVKEVEGDAVFLYAVKPGDETEWSETRQVIGAKLGDFFAAFARGIVAGSEFALCSCPSCQNVDQLKLKIVVHSGEAVFHQVGNFSDLSGVDVILVHRLLKNSVPSDEYVLMTEAAHRDIEFATESAPVRGEEHYEGFGAITTYTYLLDGAATPTPEAVEALYADRGRAWVTGMRLMGKGYFGALAVLLGLVPPRRFNDIGKLPRHPGQRALMASTMILQAPFVLLLGAVEQTRRAVKRNTLSQRRSHARREAEG